MRLLPALVIAIGLSLGGWLMQPTTAQDLLNAPPRAFGPSTNWDVQWTCLAGQQGFDLGWEWHPGGWGGAVAFAVRENTAIGKTEFCAIHLVPRW